MTAHRQRLRPTAHLSRGVTLFGLLFWGVTISFVAYVLIRTVPTVNEFMTIQRAVNTIAAGAPQTVAEVRQAFDRQKEVEYTITSISGKDLVITKENDKVVVTFAYDKEVPIVEPVYIVIKYKGRSK